MYEYDDYDELDDEYARIKAEERRENREFLASIELKNGEPNLSDRITKKQMDIEIEKLRPFANHPFKLYEGEQLKDMIESVKEVGVLVSVLVRPSGEEIYEILSGHNRVNAAKKSGLKKVPATILEGLSDAEALFIVTETNLKQRSFSDLSHSEKAIVLKTHMDAIRAQGKQTDIILNIETLIKPDEHRENGDLELLVPKLESRDKVGEKYGLNRMTVSRYVKINDLIPAMLSLVDKGAFGLYPAVSLSYLSDEEQTLLATALKSGGYKVDMKKAEILRELSRKNNLTSAKILSVLSGELDKKPKSKTPKAHKINHNIYSKYFNASVNQNEFEEIIDKALEEYFAKRQ